MNCKLILTANSGLIICMGEAVFTIDAFHNTPYLSWSTLNEEKEQKVFSVLDRHAPDAIIYTHMHPDHYSYPLTFQAMKRYPDAVLVNPAFDSEEQAQGKTVIGDCEIQWFLFPHMPFHGLDFSTNYGYIIKVNGKTLFTAGDADLNSPELAQFIDRLSFSPDIAVLNFPWATLSDGRKLLEKLSPGHTVFIHLPFAEDDRFGYLKATQTSAAQYIHGSVLMDSFLKEVTFEL